MLQVAADDFCDLFPDRPPGRSHEFELRIVSKEEIARNLDDGLAKAQQEIVRLQKMQEEANNLIKAVQKKNAGNKVTKREIDELIEAEQIQKQIQERLGQQLRRRTREELAKMQQSIKDNKLPPSKVQDQIKTLKNELERLAQEDLQQIEPSLAEARKELVGAASPTPKNKGPLDKAEKLQEQAKKTLDDLAKFLDPWASMHQIQGETAALLDKQKELRKDVEKILADKNDNGSAELEQKAQMQNDLGEDTEKLVKKIKTMPTKRNEQQDKAGEEKLEKAAEIGKGLDEKMKEVANDTQKGKAAAVQAVRNKQGENVKTLEKMLSALEGRKEDDLDRLQKKHKDAAEVKENVDKLAQDQDTLRKKTKESNKIENPEERAKELKKLAEQQEKLKEEAQKNARELARLQEEQAAKALDRAAGEMDKAAQKLEDGQNPDDNQQEALDRVEDAQAKLEEFEEELSREQLAQISDRIKGLKERQDAAVERSKELHKKVLAKMKWSTGLLETLGGDITSQKGLADETRALKEKIKEAKIFEHVFEKAAKAMDDAADGMNNRKETGKDRRIMDLEKEELADENIKALAIEKQQTLASKRLQRLLDALKNDPAEQAQNDDPNKQPDDKGAEPQEGQKMKPGDGVPPLAQLKVLRGEQLEVNEQTKELTKNHPKLENLNQEQRRQYLDSLDAEKSKQLERQLNSLEAEQQPASIVWRYDGCRKERRRPVNQRLGLTLLISSLLVTFIAAQDDPPVKKPEAKKNLDDLPPIKELEKKEPAAPATDAGDPQRVQKIIERLNKNMVSSEDRLKFKDPGEETRKIQDNIIKDLDELIKQASSGGGGGGAAPEVPAAVVLAVAAEAVAARPAARAPAANPVPRPKAGEARARAIRKPTTPATARATGTQKPIRAVPRAKTKSRRSRPLNPTPVRKARAVAAKAVNASPTTRAKTTPLKISLKTFGATCPRINVKRWMPMPRNAF